MRRTRAMVWYCAVAVATASPSNFNPFNFPLYTIETEHFRVHYHEGVESVAREVGAILEELYLIYRNTYQIVLPAKTEALVVNSVEPNGWAADVVNTILVSVNAFDFNLRGTHDWLRDVVTHEYAHIISISLAHKWPSQIPYIQAGSFTHPNNVRGKGENSFGLRTEALHVFPLEILPPWLFEGIAQYESSRRGGDRWDTHRDMILRTLTLSNKLLPWDQMFVFAGRGDDFEKTYNQGFSMIRYISETYGYEKVVALLRESARLPRLNFDKSIESVLGITARKLYDEWKKSLLDRYTSQVRSLGRQIYGRKISKKGYDNFWPRFSPDEKKIYFLSNDDNDYSYYYRALYSISLIDTVKEDKRIRREMPKVKGMYSIDGSTGLIAFVSAKSRSSTLPLHQGGWRVPDVFIDTLPSEKKRFRLFRKTERQVTRRQWTLHAVFSPQADMIACSQQRNDKFYLCLVDTGGKTFRAVYPDSTDSTLAIKTIYSLDWSPDGRRIAVSYIDVGSRKIGVYDTATKEFEVICDTVGDERDPRFNRNGTRLYFSSDRTGIFNIYRFEFETGRLERLTNVSGGAFTPDVSKDEKKLVFANYDPNGYGIYLIDSITIVEDLGCDSSRISIRKPARFERLALTHRAPSRYLPLPRKALFIPTLLGEQILTSGDDPFKGHTIAKAGLVFNLFDPMAMSGIASGNELGGYLLLEPSRIFQFIALNKNVINPSVNYDLGFFATTNMLPLPLSVDYIQRGLTGSDEFWDEREDVHRTLEYNVTFYDMKVRLSYGKGDYTGGAKLHLLGGWNRFDLYLMLKSVGIPIDVAGPYTISSGYNLGGYATALDYRPEPTMSISPRGLYAKTLGQYVSASLINDEKTYNQGKDVFDRFSFLRGTTNVKSGLPAWWFPKHTFYFELGGSYSLLMNKKIDLPYYFQPEIWWHPGYAYLYRDTARLAHPIAHQNIFKDTIIEQPYLRGVVAGNAVSHAHFSYRFPLWPRSINKKISFLYLDHLYGTVDFIAAAGWDTPFDMVKKTSEQWLTSLKKEWLKSVGAELRLEGQSFSRFPLAVRLRWDWGFDRPAPVGGQRFTLALGFSFDYWEYIETPDSFSRMPMFWIP